MHVVLSGLLHCKCARQHITASLLVAMQRGRLDPCRIRIKSIRFQAYICCHICFSVRLLYCARQHNCASHACLCVSCGYTRDARIVPTTTDMGGTTSEPTITRIRAEASSNRRSPNSTGPTQRQAGYGRQTIPGEHQAELLFWIRVAYLVGLTGTMTRQQELAKQLLCTGRAFQVRA